MVDDGAWKGKEARERAVGRGVRSAVARERQGERLTTEDAAFWALARAWSRWLPRAMMCADWEMLRARRESGLLGGLGSVMSEFATCWCEETDGEVGAARAKKLSVAVGGRGPSRGRLDERFTKRRGREPMGRQRGGALQQVPVQQRTSGQPGGARLWDCDLAIYAHLPAMFAVPVQSHRLGAPPPGPESGRHRRRCAPRPLSRTSKGREPLECGLPSATILERQGVTTIMRARHGMATGR